MDCPNDGRLSQVLHLGPVEAVQLIRLPRSPLRECQAVGLRRPAPCRGVVKWWVKDSWVSARPRMRRSKSPAEAVDGVARVVGGRRTSAPSIPRRHRVRK
jgi:hypothetical protein